MSYANNAVSLCSRHLANVKEAHLYGADGIYDCVGTLDGPCKHGDLLVTTAAEVTYEDHLSGRGRCPACKAHAEAITARDLAAAERLSE